LKFRFRLALMVGMKLRLWLLLLLCHAAAVSGGDPVWLAEVAAPPPGSREDRPALTLFPDQPPPADLVAWRPVRERLRRDWLEFLGPLPQPAEALDLKIHETEDLPRCRRSLISYAAEPGRRVDAYLLLPKADQSPRRPGLVVFHSTTAETIRAVAGTGSKPEQFIGLRLAERGFAVICPKNFLWEEKSYDAAVAAARGRHPQSRGMATMLADGMRAVDVLQSLPDVDPGRIGTIGHSLGAKEALYLLAFDDRVQAGVSSEGGVGLGFTNWDAPWYLGPEIRQAGFTKDHQQLLALIAPRPYLVIGGESGPGCADGDRTWPYIAVGQQIARLSGEPVRMGLLNHHQGHLFPPEAQERAFEWLEAVLAPGK
jgi:hypothetical protein